MTIPERLRTKNKLWESIVESAEDVPSPDWHREVLEERMREIKPRHAEWLTLDELRVALRLPKK